MSRWFESYGFAEVHRNLVIGAVPLDTDDSEIVAALATDRVLNLVSEREYPDDAHQLVLADYQRHGIREMRLPTRDHGSLAPEWLDGAVGLVTLWLERDQRVYLHCRAGWQRSAAVAAGVVARREGLALGAALDLVRSRKPSADPLPHQREDLARWWSLRETPAVSR